TTVKPSSSKLSRYRRSPAGSRMDAAPANALPASTPQATAKRAEEPPASVAVPPAAPASAPPLPSQDEKEPVTQETREVPEPAAVGEPRSQAAAEPKLKTEPEAEPEPVAEQDPEPEREPAEPAAEGSTAGQSDEEEPLPGEGEDALGDEEGEEEHEDEEPDPEHDNLPDNEENEEARERLSIDIDLSVLPKNLTQRQRAERIYVAHQAAGVALLQADLGKWAGYKNPNSGGNEYRRLEKEHGPIVVREGATHVDLNWSHQPVAA
ncbi:hypothetical protein ABZ281_25785, partial [Streptomyces sp. NPDC006265]